MLKHLLLSFLLSIFGLFGSISAQDSTVIITIGEALTPPCVENRIDIPVYMNNPVTVGGFSIEIMLTDPSWFKFDPDDLLAVDTVGACHTSWGNFEFFVHPFGYKVTVTALGPGGQNLPPRPAGQNCLIFTVHGDFDNKLVSDTCQLINFGNTTVSDSTGYINLPRVLIRDSFCVEVCDTNLVRGDVNLSGSLNGLDVTYLINYFKGGASICLGCTCLGDANTNGNVNGLDVVFLVNYFKGGPAPYPPNCPE